MWVSWTIIIILDGVIQNLSQWWRDGESGAKFVYRQSFSRFVCALGAIIGILWLLPSFRTWYIIVMFLYLSAATLADRRRAIILTDSSLIYRPVVARPINVEIAQIVSVEGCTVPVPNLYMRPRLANGMRFHMKNGQTIDVPTDFPHSRDIKQRFLTSP
jgi:hypothetical protein